MNIADRVSYGQVDIDLGSVVTMAPSLRGFQKIQNRFGGLSQAVQSVAAFNIDNVAFIVAAGANINGVKDMEALKEKIFDAGIVNIMPKVSEYLALLMNPTGKDRAENGDEPDAEK